MSNPIVLDDTAAHTLIAGAIAMANELGRPVSVAVVDPAGHVKQIARMDGAGWFSPDSAIAKARAATAFRRDSLEAAQIFSGREAYAGALTPLSGGRLILGQGGCIIKDGDEVVGAVGVSGASAGEDELCARAGIGQLVTEDQ